MFLNKKFCWGIHVSSTKIFVEEHGWLHDYTTTWGTSRLLETTWGTSWLLETTWGTSRLFLKQSFCWGTSRLFLKQSVCWGTSRLFLKQSLYCLYCSSNKVCTVCTVPQTKCLLRNIDTVPQRKFLFSCDLKWLHVTSCDLKWLHVTSCDLCWGNVNSSKKIFVEEHQYCSSNKVFVEERQYCSSNKVFSWMTVDHFGPLLRDINTVPQAKFLVEWPWTTLDHCWGTSILSLKQYFCWPWTTLDRFLVCFWDENKILVNWVNFINHFYRKSH